MSVQYGGDKITFADGSIIASGWSGFKNRIINGDMRIDQRNAGASVTPNSTAYTVDRWQLSTGVSSKLSVQQSSTAPTGFTNSVLLTSTSAYTPSASDYISYCQKVEGFNFADMMWGTASAQTVTLSFWVRSSLTGTFSGALQSDGAGRSYPFTFTISAANTFEYKTVTIAGDTSGSWNTTNGKGVELHFNMGSGSNLLGTAGAWASAWKTGATGSVALVSTSGATMYLTGVQLEKGSTATSFDYRPYGTELALCQRYFANTSATETYIYTAQAYSATGARTQAIQFKVPMRTTPTVTLGAAGNSTNQMAFLQSNNSSATVGSHSALSLTADQFFIYGTGYSGTGWSAGTATSLYVVGTQIVWAASAEL